ncbi:MAG: pyridoxal-phosphate dependent enzyme [Clostridia bacterium]|nr:pyridoxal-phosphate dependent enzyme [Clostridia bacterium]
MNTPLLYLGEEDGNRIFVKREDLYPLSMGGNKARIAEAWFREIDARDWSCVVTCGGVGSNLCRVAANLAAARGMGCLLLMHTGREGDSFNRRLAVLSGARILYCPPERLGQTIEARLAELRDAGERPFFIPGGGRGVPGFQAYAECYREIRADEQSAVVAFDYLFVPSGTGTTQAGLVCGQLRAEDPCRVVGVSVARSRERGRPVILDNVRQYFAHEKLPLSEPDLENAVVFEDAWTGGGYGLGDYSDTLREVWNRYGLPLDNTYTGKAFYGMRQYLKEHAIRGKTVLFINTGGLPLLFDDLLLREQHEGGERA